MNEESIRNSLLALYGDARRWAHEGRKLVFWYDEGGQFREVYQGLELPGVGRLELGQTPFAHKYRLLVEEPGQDYLLYAPFAEPPARDNWLLDLQLSGQIFVADQAALVMADLGFHQRALETYIRSHLSFFRARARYQALKDMALTPQATQAELRLALICVLARLKTPDGGLLVREVLKAGLDEAHNPVLSEIYKYFDAQEFWLVVQEATGYSDAAPLLRKLFVALALTHLERNWSASFPERFRSQLIGNGTRAYALVETWLKDRSDAPRWAEWSAGLAGDLQLQEAAEAADLSVYAGAETFEALDQAAIRAAAEQLLMGSADTEELLGQLRRRKGMLWFDRYRPYYQALEAAAQLFSLGRRYTHYGGDLPTLWKLYGSELYRLDRAYRHFWAAMDATTSDVLKPLAEAIENFYLNQFLEGLGQAWSDALERSGEVWPPAGLRSLSGFFTDHVQPILVRNDREKVFVVISDALRYEIAAELRERLEVELRGEASLTAMVAELPSITPLGMAALLPGSRLSWQQKNNLSDVWRDGLSTQGAQNRQKVLAKAGYGAMVLQATDLLEMNREQGREAVQPCRLIYIYHNHIDAVGDRAASEDQVFSAAADALDQLVQVVKKLSNQLNATHVLITADHGFLYQRRKVAEADKVKASLNQDLLDSNRRHLLGASLLPEQGFIRFQLKNLEGTPQVAIPRGSLRIAVQGPGSQYVHGGASLAEVAVPVLVYHHARAEKGDEGPGRKVGLQVNAASQRITANPFVLRLVQDEPVGGRIRARRVKVGYYDQAGQPVTEEISTVFESSSPNPADREQTLRFHVLITPNRNQDYFLVLRDEEDGSELIRQTWKISLTIPNDFGF